MMMDDNATATDTATAASMDFDDADVAAGGTTAEQRLLDEARDTFRRQVLTDAGVDAADTTAASSDEALQSMCDTRSVQMAQIPAGHMLAKVPLFYPDASESGPDRTVANLRAIPCGTFIDRGIMVMDIVRANPEQQIALSKKLITHIIAGIPAGEDVSALQSLVDMAIGLAYDVNSKTHYADVTNRGLLFDRIVQCVVDDRYILTEAVPSSYGGYHFYSQMASPDEVRKVRLLMGDSDQNRAYRAIDYATAMLSFQPDHLCPSISTFINLGLVLQCLVVDSILVEGNGRNDLRPSLIAFIIDGVIRSRVMTAWQWTPSARKLLADQARTHHKDHYVVKAIGAGSAAARFELFKRFATSTEDLGRMLAKVDYGAYMAFLGSTAVPSESGLYFTIDHRTFMHVMTMLPMDMLQPNGGLAGGGGAGGGPPNVSHLVNKLQHQLHTLATEVPLPPQQAPPNKRPRCED